MSDNVRFSGYVEYSRKKYRLIPIEKTWINSGTPVGEPAEYWERKPYGGRREFCPIFRILDGIVVDCYRQVHIWDRKRWEYTMAAELAEFMDKNGIQVPEVECGCPKTTIIRPKLEGAE